MRQRPRLSTRRIAACLAVAGWAIAGSGGATTAADAEAGITAAGIELGQHVAGPLLTPASLAHRVVLLEFWGVNCPPCIRSMPLLEELHREFGPRGLVVVGAHAQGGSAAELEPKVKELGVSFTIDDRGSVAGGMDFRGIPHCLLFDHTGACVYRGSPFDVGDAVTQAVAAAPAGVLEGRQLVKLAEADGLRANDPIRAADAAQRCSTCFKGTTIGSDAAARLREWKKDKAFQAALRAGQQLAMLEAVREAAARAGGLPPTAVGKVRSLVQAIRQAAPDSRAAQEAATIAGELGVTVAGP